MSVRKTKKKNDDTLQTIINAMQEVKGNDIISLDFKKIPTAVCDFFVICSASSYTQVDAIAKRVLENMQKNHSINPMHKEGFENSEWILIDYFDIVVHIFLESTRSFFKLEDLWADAEISNHNE